MGRERAADEVFCRSCGRAIKREAELCPHCGVRNDVRDVSGIDQRSTGAERTQPKSRSATRPRREPDATGADDAGETQLTDETASESGEETGEPANGETGAPASEGDRPDSRWRYGVAASLALWIGLYLVGGAVQGNVVVTAAVFLAWVALPVTVLLDARAIQSTSEGTPTPVLWALATAVPVLNLLLGVIYLYRRREALRSR